MVLIFVNIELLPIASVKVTCNVIGSRHIQSSCITDGPLKLKLSSLCQPHKELKDCWVCCLSHSMLELDSFSLAGWSTIAEMPQRLNVLEPSSPPSPSCTAPFANECKVHPSKSTLLIFKWAACKKCLAGRRWGVIKGITLAYTHYLKAPVKESCTYIVLVCFNKYHTGLDFQSWDIHIRQSFPVTSLMLFNVLSVTSEITSNSQPLFWLEMPKLHIIKTCTDPMNCVMLFPKRWYCTAGLWGGRFHIKTFASALWKSWRYFWGLPDKVKLHNHSEMTLYTHGGNIWIWPLRCCEYSGWESSGSTLTGNLL